MRGVILAGGLGTRLAPLTNVTNKHLLPVFDKPMIYYPLECLVNAGITDILIVTGGKHAGDFLELLGNGEQFGLTHLHYTYQRGQGGIADALSLAEDFTEGDKVCVFLGDTIIEGSINDAVTAFERQDQGAKILLKKVEDPRRYGVARFEGDQVVEIIEKPTQPPSPFAVTGIYFYDSSVFKVCGLQTPSARGELEITDVNNHFIREGRMSWDILEGWWTDAGTFETLLRASKLVAETGANKVKLNGTNGL